MKIRVHLPNSTDVVEYVNCDYHIGITAKTECVLPGPVKGVDSEQVNKIVLNQYFDNGMLSVFKWVGADKPGKLIASYPAGMWARAEVVEDDGGLNKVH